MRLFLVLLASASGCAQLFGIQDTSGRAPPGKAQLTITRQSVGATVVASPLDVTSQSATFYDPDTLAAVPGEQADVNVWQGAIATGNPSIEYSLPDLPKPFGHFLAIPSRDVHAHFIAYEHPDPQPAPAGAMEQLTLALPTPYDGAQTFLVSIVGAWMEHTLAGAELPASSSSAISTTIPYAMFTPMTASPAARYTSADAVLVLRYSGAKLTGVYQAPPKDQADTTDAIGDATATMQQVATDKMISGAPTPTAYDTRLQTATPAPTAASLAMSYSINAVPGIAVGALGGPQLDAGAVATTSTGGTLTGTYGNPFDTQGWKAVLQFVATETRQAMVGTTPATLAAQMATYQLASSTVTLDFPAPLPQMVSLDATQLASDGASVPLDPTATHTVTITTEASPAATLYVVDVVELVVNGNAIDRTVVLDARSTDPVITLPPGTFKQGSTYTLTAGTVAGGFTNVASGDLDAVALPFTVSQIDSGTFTVVAP